MSIPNPNPNIADGIKSDNKTYSSNKIESLISAATELPIPEAGDAGKVLTVNAAEDGYELDTIMEVKDLSTEVTLPEGVSIAHGYIYQYGKLVSINLVLKAEANVANNDILIDDIPEPVSNIRFPRGDSANQYSVTSLTTGGLATSTLNSKFNIANMGAITASEASPAYIFINISYIAK